MNPERQLVDVLKFGGTSVGDFEAIRQSCKIIDRHIGSEKKIAIVVSAMAGVTDLLHQACDLARAGADFQDQLCQIETKHTEVVDELGDDSNDLRDLIQQEIAEAKEQLEAVRNLKTLSAKTQDRIVSTGERISPYLLTACLENRQNAIVVDAGKIIRTDNRFTDASADIDTTKSQVEMEVAPRLLEGKVVVTGGYYGLTPDGQIATFGRGGSDLTATLLARTLHDLGNSPSVYLYKKDVDGVETADPRIVSSTKVIAHLTRQEAQILASLGGKILHPRAVQVLNSTEIPIYCRGTADPSSQGTLIDNRELPEDLSVKAVTMLYPLRVLKIEGVGMDRPGIARRVFQVLASLGIDVRAIVQPPTELAMNIVLPGKIDAGRIEADIKDVLAQEIATKDVSLVTLEETAIVGVIGEGVGDPRVLRTITGILYNGPDGQNTGSKIINTHVGERLYTVMIEGEDVQGQAQEITRSIHHVLFERKEA